MGNKGLFDLMFMLIMLALLMPAATHSQHIVTPTVQSQVNELSLLTDEAIADAISDKTFEGCAYATVVNYEGVIRNYLDDLYLEYNAHGNNCSYDSTSLSASLSGGKFSGSIDVFCSQENSSNSAYLKKRLFFDKQIIAQSTTGFCQIIIQDNQTPGYIQVDYNLSNS